MPLPHHQPARAPSASPPHHFAPAHDDNHTDHYHHHHHHHHHDRNTQAHPYAHPRPTPAASPAQQHQHHQHQQQQQHAHSHHQQQHNHHHNHHSHHSHHPATLARKRVKLLVPADKHPEYNFVGRLLGPRGTTLKTLERETGCKIMIRGKGSIRKDKEADVRGKPGWEHVFSEPLHVVIEVSDAVDDADSDLALVRAKEAVRLLLVPVPEERDGLKRQQLRDLAILNGTFRGTAAVPSLQSPHCYVPHGHHHTASPQQGNMQSPPLHPLHNYPHATGHQNQPPSHGAASNSCVGSSFMAPSSPLSASIAVAGGAAGVQGRNPRPQAASIQPSHTFPEGDFVSQYPGHQMQSRSSLSALNAIPSPYLSSSSISSFAVIPVSSAELQEPANAGVLHFAGGRTSAAKDASPSGIETGSQTPRRQKSGGTSARFHERSTVRAALHEDDQEVERFDHSPTFSRQRQPSSLHGSSHPAVVAPSAQSVAHLQPQSRDRQHGNLPQQPQLSLSSVSSACTVASSPPLCTTWGQSNSGVSPFDGIGHGFLGDSAALSTFSSGQSRVVSSAPPPSLRRSTDIAPVRLELNSSSSVGEDESHGSSCAASFEGEDAVANTGVGSEASRLGSLFMGADYYNGAFASGNNSLSARRSRALSTPSTENSYQPEKPSTIGISLWTHSAASPRGPPRSPPSGLESAAGALRCSPHDLVGRNEV